MGANPGRLCWSNRNLVGATLLATDNTFTVGDDLGSSYRCGETCRYRNGCVGYTFSFTNIFTGAGTCKLYSNMGAASTTITTNTNIYVLDTYDGVTGDVNCPKVPNLFQ